MFAGWAVAATARSAGRVDVPGSSRKEIVFTQKQKNANVFVSYGPFLPKNIFGRGGSIISARQLL